MFRSPSKEPAPANPDAKAQGAPSPQQAAEPPRPEPQPAPQPSQAQTPPQPRRENTASVLGADLLIKGGIEGRGEIQLQGRAWGDVKVERLVVGDAAELEGSVDAVVVEIRGRVAGSITARQVRLLPTAKVEGDITYEQLAIELGAQFEGRCIRQKTATPPLNLPKTGATASTGGPPPTDEFSDEAFGAPASAPAAAPAPSGEAKPAKAV